MANRFGRNQRRRMQATLVEMDREIGVSREMLSEAMNRSAARGREADELRARLTTWAQDVVRLMGEDSAFNERVRRMTVDERYVDGGRLRLDPIVDLAPIRRSAEAMPPMTVQTIITALIWRLHVSRDEFRPMIRIELQNRFAEPIGYALAEEHIWTERDIGYLSERIAREMVNLRNGVDKPRRRA